MAEMDWQLRECLQVRGCNVSVYILEFGHKGTDDFQANLARLHQYPAVDIHFIQEESIFHTLSQETVIIDALFGSGLTRPIEGFTANLSIILMIAVVQ
jgi:NAD(P)H-hydrate epimerase